MGTHTRQATQKPGGDLGGAIRNIRLRMNLVQVEFAQSIGLRQATLCQYELGIARPGAGPLVALLRLSQTEDERAPFLAALETRGILASDLALSLLGKHCTIGPAAGGVNV